MFQKSPNKIMIGDSSSQKIPWECDVKQFPNSWDIDGPSPAVVFTNVHRGAMAKRSKPRPNAQPWTWRSMVIFRENVYGMLIVVKSGYNSGK